jgi:hypothetical protein
MAYKASTKSMDLVADDYYEKEVKYQEQISKMKNTTEVTKDFSIEENESHVVITFPGSAQPEGTIVFFRPSDKTMDKSYKVALGPNHQQMISKSDLQKGRYEIRADWKEGAKQYFIKKDIFIQ